ncbi:MAG: hypothetical protein JO053_03940 [Acidobacteria bacterium]|nr:hypothetical protein [Acidobacteriota bacterium]
MRVSSPHVSKGQIIMKKLLPFVCFVLFVGTALAQSPSPSPAYSETADAKPVASPEHRNERPATLDELKAKVKAAKAKDDVILAWDKFKDESIIMSKPENIVGSWEGAFAVMATSGYGRPGIPRLIMVALETRFPQQTLRETPEDFLLVFDGMSPDWQWLKSDKRLYFLFDGDKRMQLAPMASDTDVGHNAAALEKIAYVITREQAAALANAAKVELRIGTAPPRELKPKVLEKWKTFLAVTQLDPATGH